MRPFSWIIPGMRLGGRAGAAALAALAALASTTPLPAQSLALPASETFRVPADARVSEPARAEKLSSSAAALHGGETRSDGRAATRPLHIAGFGALSGPVRAFGINSRAALTAATDSINRTGGVRLADGAVGRFVVSYADDHCAPSDGIALARRIAASDALVAVGPSCSSVAEPLYHALRSTAGDGTSELADTGLALPVFTDGATKANLARISPWAFRNAPDEIAMYPALWAWVRRRYPSATTIAAGEEADFAHSHSTWQNIIGPSATAAGLRVLGAVGWSILDTALATPVARLAAMRADVVVLSAHAVGTCAALREMHRQGVRPVVVVGLTSASSEETLARCGADAEGLLIPTSFVRTSREGRAAASAVERAGGAADLHSMAAWEIVFALRRAIELAGIVGLPETLAADRRRLRDALAGLTTMDGVLGPIVRTPDRESRKPFVLVRAHAGAWQVVNAPARSAGEADTPR